MATVEQQIEQDIPQAHNGVAQDEDPAHPEIAVENPATGATIATVADLDGDAVAELATRARAAQPGWEAFGFEGRARVLSRMQKWVMDNAEQIATTIVSETGKTFEDAQIGRAHV